MVSGTALVTGGGRGIGAAVCRALAASGLKVYINYSSSSEKAEELKKEIISSGGQAETVCCDVSVHDDVKKMIGDVVKEEGSLDVLVNNAGITKDGLLMTMKEASFDRVIDVNLKGTFNTMKHASLQMIRQGSGRIINISSVSGLHGNPGQANYSASKAGIIGLTKTAARELAPKGITVNAIAPGFIETDMTDVLKDEVKEKILSTIPLGHIGSAGDVAAAAAFLASEGAGYITGQTISVDGGMTV